MFLFILVDQTTIIDPNNRDMTKASASHVHLFKPQARGQNLPPFQELEAFALLEAPSPTRRLSEAQLAKLAKSVQAAARPSH